LLSGDGSAAHAGLRETWHGPAQWGLQAVKGAGAMPRLYSWAVLDTRPGITRQSG